MTDPIFHMIATAAAAVAPYSHVVEHDGWLFVTGQIANDPANDANPLPDGIAAQTHQVMENLRRSLAGVGATLAHALMIRVYLTDFARDYDAMNAIYQTCFPHDRRPARTTVGVTGLARGAIIEIDIIAKR